MIKKKSNYGVLLNFKKLIIFFLILSLLIISSCKKEDYSVSKSPDLSQSLLTKDGVGDKYLSVLTPEEIPEYSGEDYVVVNNGIPYFTPEQLTRAGFEKYGNLDSLGRCTAALASLGKDTMPTGERGNISSVKPTGWVQARYSCIKSSDLYNRSHLIAWSLAGEDANVKNLITGTSYMNQEVMTQFEDMVYDYIKETENHVAYRVTPLFKGNELVCRGVQMEAFSVEDDGEGICFNVFCFNVQPEITINYMTGESRAESDQNKPFSDEIRDFVLNKKTKKIHLPDCKSALNMSDSNKETYKGTINDLGKIGFTPCSVCLG